MSIAIMYVILGIPYLLDKKLKLNLNTNSKIIYRDLFMSGVIGFILHLLLYSWEFKFIITVMIVSFISFRAIRLANKIFE
jgi:xanthine/uracil permease